MKVIETKYKGYLFRSRLEARWAVFFDACGVKWEYEPEGFDLGEGIYYLPDFLLHNVLFRDEDVSYDLWVEVKGIMNEIDAKKIINFANLRVDENDMLFLDETGKILGCENPLLVVTNIPDGDDINDIEDYMRNLAYEGNEPYPFNFQTIDGDWFGAFPFINKQGRFVIKDDNQRCIGGEDEKATEKAYRLARQVRFEHR